MVMPRSAVEPEVRVPRDAGPVHLQTLNLKFRGGIFHVEARTRISPIVQEPVDRIDLCSNVDSMRLEPLSARRCNQTETFRPPGSRTNPSLGAVQVSRDENGVALLEVREQPARIGCMAVEQSLD